MSRVWAISPWDPKHIYHVDGHSDFDCNEYKAHVFRKSSNIGALVIRLCRVLEPIIL